MPKFKVSDIAKRYGVTRGAVYHWLRGGLKYSSFREIGKKEYKIIDTTDVDTFLDLGIKENSEE